MLTINKSVITSSLMDRWLNAEILFLKAMLPNPGLNKEGKCITLFMFFSYFLLLFALFYFKYNFFIAKISTSVQCYSEFSEKLE